MPYNKTILSRVRREYETKYLRAQDEADARRREIHVALPAVAEIDAELRLTGLSIMAAAVEASDVEARIAEVRERNGALRARRAVLMAAAGYPADYTDPHYECALCNDSGFVDLKMCDCMRRRIIEETYAASGISTLLRTQTFDNFDLGYYADDAAAHRRMTQILALMKRFAENFRPGESESIVLFGGTGLGKTHLSSAVASTVIEGGHDVCYVSAVSLLADFEFNRFGNRSAGASAEDGVDTDRYYDCDLLIIDDLGTEVANQFTTSVLYDLINTRLCRHRATIISTNLTQEDFRRRYWDRITSRVLGEYTVLPFLGKDVRAQKLGRG